VRRPTPGTQYSDVTGTTKVATTSFTYDVNGNLTHEQHKVGAGANIENSTFIKFRKDDKPKLGNLRRRGSQMERL